MAVLPPGRGNIGRGLAFEGGREVADAHRRAFRIVGIDNVAPAVVDDDVRLQAADPGIDLVGLQVLDGDAVPAHAVQPQDVDLAVSGQEFLQLCHHIGEKVFEGLPVGHGVFHRTPLTPGSHVPFGLRPVSGVVPVPRRIVESHLEPGIAASLYIRFQQVASVHVLFGADAVFRRPKGVSVVVTGGEHGVGKTRVRCRLQVFFGMILLRIEAISLAVIFFAAVVLAAPLIVFDHVPGRLDADHAVDAPVHEKAQTRLRIPLGPRCGVGIDEVLRPGAVQDVQGLLQVLPGNPVILRPDFRRIRQIFGQLTFCCRLGEGRQGQRQHQTQYAHFSHGL